jgi:hypothetical protein
MLLTIFNNIFRCFFKIDINIHLYLLSHFFPPMDMDLGELAPEQFLIINENKKQIGILAE